MDTQELINKALEIRDEDGVGENTALRVGSLLLDIIDALTDAIDSDTLQLVLTEFASLTSNGKISWEQSRCVIVASMGSELDNVDGDDWAYTEHNGDIVFNPTGKYLRVVGTSGNYALSPGVLYINAHSCHAYKWDNVAQKMAEITDSSSPSVITYRNTPPFSDVAIGESYYYESGATKKIAVKLSSESTYSFDIDPKKIYVFKDVKQTMVWSSGTWVPVGGDGGKVINDLTTGGTDDPLSAEMGKRLKSKVEEVYQRVQSIYSLLGNIAFWDGKPASATILPNLDWGNPKHTVAITNNLSNSTITMNGNPVSGSFQAEEGSTVTLIVAPASSSYALTGVSYVKDGGSPTSATSLGDGTYKIEFVMGSSDVAITVSGTAVSAYSISYTLSGCDATTRPTSIVSGGSATIVLAANQGHVLPASLPSGAVTGATIVSYTPSQDGSSATLVIGGSITGNVAIAITAGVSYAGTSVSVKKITAWPVLNSSFAPTPSDWSMTIVDDNTINCTVSANGKINIPSGYGLFSAVLTMDNVDISECIAFDTLTINVPNVTGTLALAVVVAEAVDGMFIGKSFHGSEGTTKTNPGCLVQGGVPTAPTSATANDDWCCMSEFAAIPSTANKFKIVYGNIFKNNENNTTTQPHNKRGVYVFLNAKGKYNCHYAIYSGGTTERIIDWPVAQSALMDGDAVYVRASFIKNKLADSALYYSTDGGNTWVQIFDGSQKTINS